MRKVLERLQQVDGWVCWVLKDNQVSLVDIDTLYSFHAKNE